MGFKTSLVLLGCLWPLVTAPLQAQGREQFRDRLSPLPVDRRTVPTISGWGEVAAELDGHELTISATFEGMSSPAVAAHVHRARKGLHGPVAFAVEVPRVVEGTIEDTVTLTDTQRRELQDGLLYLQIHTDSNAEGELRGWLLPRP